MVFRNILQLTRWNVAVECVCGFAVTETNPVNP